MSLFIKICGITRLEDAVWSEKSGANAIGFIFVKRSPRFLKPSDAGEISKGVSESLMRVGVFSGGEADEIARVSQIARLTHLQLHSRESNEYILNLKKKTGLPLIQTVSVEADLSPFSDYYLFESEHGGERGGLGRTGDWELAKKIRESTEKPLLLSGGINESNVLQALQAVAPFGVDLSSGVEDSPGKKSSVMISKFFDTVRAAHGYSKRS